MSGGGILFLWRRFVAVKSIVCYLPYFFSERAKLPRLVVLIGDNASETRIRSTQLYNSSAALMITH